MLGRRRLHTDVTSPFWIIWLHYIVEQSSAPKVSSATFSSLSACLGIQHTGLCVSTPFDSTLCECAWREVYKDTKASERKGVRLTLPLTFLGPPGQEAWRARSDFWSRLFPVAYKNKWSKLPRVITRKWLRLAASHFSTHNTACISKWQSHAVWCIYWL